VRAGSVELLADLRDTPTAEVLWMLLPVSGRAARWGDEFYFRLESMLADLEADARDVLEIGEIGFWVQGQAIAIFFGPTPASRADEPRAVTPVNVVGKIRDHATSLDRLEDGVQFTIEATES
jgi:hypothetical protein